MKDFYSENYKTKMKPYQRWHKQMETYTTMFLDWENQYCQTEYTIQGNQEMNAILIKVPMAFFTKLEQKKKILKFYM